MLSSHPGYLYEDSNIVQLVDSERRMLVARAWRRGSGEVLPKGGEVSVVQDEAVRDMCCAPVFAGNYISSCTCKFFKRYISCYLF